MPSAYQISIDVLVSLGLILLYSFFSSFELAVISLNDSQIKRESVDGRRDSARLWRLMSEPGQFLATSHAGRTLVGCIAAVFVNTRFGNPLIAAVKPTHWAGVLALRLLLILLLMLLLLIFGDQLPRRIAQEKPDGLARRGYLLYRFMAILLKPLVWLISHATNMFLRLFGIDPNQTDRVVTEEELRMLLDAGRESGNILEQEKILIENIFEFDDKIVSECMTHRTEIIALAVEADLNETIGLVIAEQYTRIPVYEESIDNIIGILHSKDLLYEAIGGAQRPFSLRDMMRPAFYAPETRNIHSLFREMQSQNMQMCIVIDEYGGTAGLVTIEDLLEEIVGNIQDEYDLEEPDLIQLQDHVWRAEGSTPLDEVAAVCGLTLPDDYDTIAGLVLHLLDRIPDETEQPIVQYKNLRMQVLEMDENRISRIRLECLPEAKESEHHDKTD